MALTGDKEAEVWMGAQGAGTVPCKLIQYKLGVCLRGVYPHCSYWEATAEIHCFSNFFLLNVASGSLCLVTEGNPEE